MVGHSYQRIKTTCAWLNNINNQTLWQASTFLTKQATARNIHNSEQYIANAPRYGERSYNIA